MMAPVSVARSTMNFGLKRLAAYQITSASTRRPSASVLMISMVWPDIEVTMSPGRCALPSGMFSTRPMTPTALTRALRAASACSRPTTQAAPAMSPFMSSMEAAGLIEMPPVSKQTPLPMKATGAAPLVVLLLGLVAIEGVGAQPHALRQIGRLLGVERAAGELGEHAAVIGAHRQFAHGGAAELEDVLGFKLAGLAGADHHQAGDFEPLRQDQLERRAA